MRRRSRAGDKRVKSRRKSATVKHRNASNLTSNRSASIAGQETIVARLTYERDQAMLRETANSEILGLISQSPGDLELVFRKILEHATRICNANFGTLYRFDGESFQPAAQFNTPTALLEAQIQRGPFKPTPGTAIDQVMRKKQVFHSADDAAETAPGLAVKFGGARSLVAVPMLKNDTLIGVILIYHQEVRPFGDKQIELVKNFAAQAVIAIENARLLNELRHRTADLSESLEQQTATSEVLRVISSSPGDLKPVFDAILQHATRICEASFGTLYLAEGGNSTARSPRTTYHLRLRKRVSEHHW
jgi:transcriptional regulator with GAF, ATPase, and Fis domain